MEGPVGQASALKMCYAGLTKGLHAVGVSVIRGAIEAGIEGPFFAELAVGIAAKQIHVDAATDQALVRNFAGQLANSDKSGKDGN